RNRSWYVLIFPLVVFSYPVQRSIRVNTTQVLFTLGSIMHRVLCELSFVWKVQRKCISIANKTQFRTRELERFSRSRRVKSGLNFIFHHFREQVIVAVREDELPRLDKLYGRGLENGVEGLRIIGPEELAKLEPHVKVRQQPHRCLQTIHLFSLFVLQGV